MKSNMLRRESANALLAFVLVSLGWCSSDCLPALAQVEVEGVFPPAVAAGSTSTLKAEGKLPVWPVEVSCDRQDIKLLCLDEPGQFEVTVEPGAAPGLAWLRLFDVRSASDLIPLMVETNAVAQESEPNDNATAVACVAPAVTIAGRLEKNGDVDCFAIHLAAGQRLSATLIANQILGSPMDAVMQLVDRRGNVLVQSDDARGLDPQCSFESAVEQEVVIRLFAFPETPNSTIGFAGGQNFVYALRLTTDARVDHFLPLVAAPGAERFAAFTLDGPAAGTEVAVHQATGIAPAVVFARQGTEWQWIQPAQTGHTILETDAVPTLPELPLVYSGHVSQPGEIDHCEFAVIEGTTYQLRVHSQELGYSLDSMLRVLDEEGAEIARNDDRSRSEYDAALQFQSKRTGQVRAEISDLADSGSWRHAYSLIVRALEPEVDLRLPADHFALQAGSSLEIPLTIERRNGFDHALELVAEDLPGAVTLDKATSDSNGESSKTLQLKLHASPQAATGHFQFRLTAKTSDQPPHATFACRHAPRLGRDTRLLWLTVLPAEKN
jgi:hypothetical protein